MKKISIISGLVCLLMAGGWSLSAGPVTADRALDLAGRVLPVVGTRAGAEPLKVLWDGETAPSPLAPALYVVGRESGGFVIVAGDDRVCPVLAISDKGRFEVEGMPANVRWWMERMKAYVRSVPVPEVGAAEGWALRTRSTAALPDAGVTDKVERLTPEWDQGNNDEGFFGENIFNAKCPLAGATRTITGCVAVALGEILTYQSGISGIEMPSAAHGTITYEEYMMDFEGGYAPVSQNNPYVLGTSYNWAGLRTLTDFQAINAAKDAGNQALLDNLAQLLADLGAIVHASYGVDGTSAHVNLSSLADHLDINKRAHFEKLADYTTRQWISMLKAEIDQRPVLISGKTVAAVGQYSNGSPYYAGHQFVFDGYGTYNGETVFHVNFGWGGYCNGYYRHVCLDSEIELNGSRDYSRDLEAVFDFYPDATSTYATSLSFMSVSEAARYGVGTGLSVNTAITPGSYFSLYIEALQNTGVAPYTGEMRVVRENRAGVADATPLMRMSINALPSGSYYPQLSGSNLRVNQIAFGDRLVVKFSSNDAPGGWETVGYLDDGTVMGDLPLMPAPFIRTEANYSAGDYFEFKIKNNGGLYAGTVWTVTAPDGTRTSYAQSDRECCLNQTGKYKIEAAIAPAVGETVTDRVVAVITVQ